MDKVVSINGHWNLAGTVFTGKVELESGKRIQGEHGEHDYDWNGFWNI
jgi:hypothetical protein